MRKWLVWALLLMLVLPCVARAESVTDVRPAGTNISQSACDLGPPSVQTESGWLAPQNESGAAVR